MSDVLALVLIRLRVTLVRLDSAPPVHLPRWSLTTPRTHAQSSPPGLHACATLGPRCPSEGSRESRAVVG
jgi:hypothetical protein